MATGSGLSGADASLILTLEMDGESFAHFDALRRRFYPPDRNFVPAHVTLFRRLPAERSRDVKALLGKVAAAQKRLDVAVGPPRPMERGVAFFLQSPQLVALRQALADEWWPWLGDEDGTGFQPHVTIQSTVSAGEARRTLQALADAPARRRVVGVGLHLWRYLGGPWEDERLFRFR